MIAEQRIAEAMEAGSFDNLPGAGQPLQLEDLSHLPEDCRMACKILKNSGCIPPELADRKEAARLIDFLDNCADEQERLKQMQKLELLLNRITHGSRRHLALVEHDEYYHKILARLEAHKRNFTASSGVIEKSKKA